MERTHLAVLVVVVAVVGLLGLRLASRGTSPADGFAGDVAPGMLGPDGARVRRLPLSNDDPQRPGEPRKPGQPPGGPGSDKRGGRSGGAGGVGGAHGSADVIAGGPRSRNVIGAGSGRRRGGGDDATASDSLAGARMAAVPPSARGARDLNIPGGEPGRHTFEFVDEQPNDPGADAPLLSIPFKGDVDVQAGGAPSESSGLVAKDDGVEFTTDAQLTFPAGGHVNGDAGTISFDIAPNWTGTDETNNSMVQIRNQHVWENSLEIVKNFNTLRFIIIDEGGVERNVNVFIDDWQPGESHTVDATWGEALMSLYVDRQLVGQATMPNSLSFLDTTPIHIGSDFPGTAYSGAAATIRNFQLYGRALNTDEITRR